MLHRPIAVPADVPAGHADVSRWTTRRFVLAVLAMWLVASVAMIATRWQRILDHAFFDVDDELRLVEVRDWLNGQSFWDVSQHRMNQPFGGPMHWSRIVDAPIAATELLLRPLLGADNAQWAAAAIVPLSTLAAAMLLLALIARRLSGPVTGLYTAATMPTAIVTTMQIQPLRVDHHGWEIVAALAALAASLSERRRWAGLLAGAAIAIGLQISLELLPFALALGAVIAARWLLDPSPVAGRRFAGYAAALLVVEAVLVAVLHRPAEWGVTYCDAVSPPHLLALAIVGIAVPACVAIAPRSIQARGAALAGVAAIAAAAFRAVPPHCGLDPFSALGPLERRFWLANVLEGQPVWHAGATIAITSIGFPVLGLVCTWFAARGSDGITRTRWIAYGAVLLAATVVGTLVFRASALAGAIALVPAAHAAVRLLPRTLRHDSALVRILGSAAVVVLLNPWAPGVFAAMLPNARLDPARHRHASNDCDTADTFRALDTLPPARVLAPLDVGPPLLLKTHHAVLATGHHRNHLAMADEIRAMIGSPEQAERVVRRHGMQYVLMCPELGEMSVYRKASKHGFGVSLAAGVAPPWLERVRLPGSQVAIWRVLPAQPPAGLPSSRLAGGSVPAAAQISRSAALSPSS